MLIVEDEPALAMLVGRVLAKHGIASETTPHGGEAVAWLTRAEFSVILLDYNLTDGLSWPVLDAARASPMAPPVIMMSGQGDEWLAAEAVQRGVADFRVKTDSFWKVLPSVVLRVALQASAERTRALLASIVESSDDAIIGLTSQGAILSWNAAASRMFGHSAQEALGRSLSDYVCPESLPDLETALAGQGGNLDRLETQGIRAGGERFDLSLTLSSLHSRSGNAGACATARNVSSERQAQRELLVRLQQQAAVAELGRHALQGDDVQSLLEQSVGLAARTFGVEYSVIGALLPNGDLRFRAGFGWSPQVTVTTPSPESQGWFTLQCGQPVISSDLTREVRFKPAPILLEKGVTSGLSLAIQGEREPFGVFAVYSVSPRQFSPDDVNFLQSLAHVLGSAIQRQQSKEALLERHRLSLFEAQVFRALSQHTQEAALLAACLQACVTHLEVRLARVWLFDSERRELTLRASVGHPPVVDVLFQRVPVGRHIIGRIAESGCSEHSNTFLVDPDVVDPDWVAQAGIVGFAGHPLIVEGRVEGVLAVYSCGSLSDAIPTVLQGVADGIAQALARLRFQTELRVLRQALEQSPVGVVMSDAEGTIEYVNPRFVEMSGYSVEEAVGQKTSLANSGFHAVEFHQQLWTTILSGQVFECEICNRRKNGEVYWQQALIAPVRNEAGEIAHFTSFQEEITDRKLMERELAESEEKFRGIFEAMQDGYVAANLKGEMTLANPAAVRLLGYPNAAALLAMPLSAVFSLPHEQRDLRDATLQAGRQAYHRGTFVRQDGELRVFEGSTWIRPGPDGQPQSLESLFHDITERVQADEERQARQAADEANQLKSQFLAHMSHEIRTPLHAILGMAHLALNTPLNDRLKHYLGHIQRGGQALLAIVNDILDFSKVEAGKLDLEQVEFYLDDVIENLVSVLASKAHAKGLEFLVEVADEVPGHLVGDPLRLGQVLVNLVGNAVKFTARGTVILSIRREDSTRLRFEVRDTGVGLTEKQIGGLFVSFAQADSSITREYGGTGLGLAISARLVHLMQGEIEVRSQPGEGSTFTFTACFGRLEHASFPELSDLRALVIERDGGERELLATSLRRVAIQVHGATTSEAALLEVISACPPYDLIFIDFHLPGRLNCIETIRRLRAAAPQSTLIVMVASHGTDVAERASSVGVNSVLFKPFSTSNVVDTVLNLLDRPELKHWRGDPVVAEAGNEDREAIAGARVLLVEDNRVNQEIARELLQSAGVRVDIASHGREAVDMLRQGEGRWQVVLMDLQMPEMDGYSATAAIRKDPRFATLPILAMTAHVLPEERQRCASAGMDDYISKPIDPAVLFATLSRWIKVTGPPAPLDGAFPPIAGLDTVAGLARVAGNQSLYRSLLLELARQAPSTSAALERARGSELVGLAHALRGMSGNLGARDLSAQAADLERLARTDQPVEACRTRLSERLLEVEGAIRAALDGSTPAPAVPAGSPAAVGEAAARLEELLRNWDGRARAACQELRQLQPGCELLAELVAGFKFPDALEELGRLNLCTQESLSQS